MITQMMFPEIKQRKEYQRCKMKVWITKYALTRGIIETTGVQGSIHPESCIAIMTHPNGHKYEQGFWAGDWHKNPFSAKDKADAMRNRKIESLNKQIHRLDKIQF